jgi:hypothetical protein
MAFAENWMELSAAGLTASQEPEMAAQLSGRQFLHAGVESNENTAPFHLVPDGKLPAPQARRRCCILRHSNPSIDTSLLSQAESQFGATLLSSNLNKQRPWISAKPACLSSYQTYYIQLGK